MKQTIRRLARPRYLCFVLLAVLVFTLLGGVYHSLVLSKTQTLIVRLSWSGAEKGLNPDGSRFRLSELTCDAVLDGAKAGLSIADQSNDAIRDCLRLTNRLSQDGLEEAAAKLARGAEAARAPTTLYLTYTQRDKLAPNESAAFLRALAEQYTAYFHAQHGENNAVLTFDPGDPRLADCGREELLAVLQDRADRMLDLLQEHSGGFRWEGGQTLSTLRDSLRSFRDITLTSLQDPDTDPREVLDRFAQLSQQAKALDDQYLAWKTEGYVTCQLAEEQPNLLPFAGLGLVFSLLCVCRLEYSRDRKRAV